MDQANALRNLVKSNINLNSVDYFEESDIIETETVIITPEADSIIKAYAQIKRLNQERLTDKFRIIIENSQSEKERDEVFKRLKTTAERFLNVEILESLPKPKK